jgi:5-methylthioribose kinase
LVLRVKTNSRTFILKQSREFVQKYPQIPAPIERIKVEAAFYKTISSNDYIKHLMPNLLAFDSDNYLLVLEDLGQNSDYTTIYQPDSEISENEIIALTEFLNQLHALDVEKYPTNQSLKALNHFHIFKFPFDNENGFDLDQIQPGLQEISLKYKNDAVLKSKIEHLGEKYLAEGKTLIHGDFYPGSWLKAAEGIKIIDPEFGYLGIAEFDLGVFIAHLVIANKIEFINTVNSYYKKTSSFNNKLMYAFAGVEIMRRLLGVAQLPLALKLNEKEEILEWAYSQIKNYEN